MCNNKSIIGQIQIKFSSISIATTISFYTVNYLENGRYELTRSFRENVKIATLKLFLNNVTQNSYLLLPELIFCNVF